MVLEIQENPLKNNSFKILAFAALLGLVYLSYPKLSHIAQWKVGGKTPAIIVSTPEAKDFAQAGIFKQTLRYISRNYYDTQALNPRELLKESLLGLSRSVTEILVNFPEGRSRFTIQVAADKRRIAIPTFNNAEDILPIIQEAFSFVAQHYQGETKFSDMEYAAINSMLHSLDPHSSLLPPKIFTEFKTQTEGEFGGIGIVIGMREGDLTVIAPLPNTPADRAGLKPKDKIVQINDEATINMSLSEAVERLRGKVGTKVSIAIEREGAPAPLQVALNRAKIKIESVQSKLIKEPDGDIGIIKLKSFQEETLREVRKHINKMKKESDHFFGLILDLRNNPGGLLNQAVDIADLFLKDGTIVLTAGANNQILEINRAQSYDANENYPLVVLVNEGSASASEIVAGALKKNNRAVILGHQTFGKGSVQSVYPLKEGAALKMTVAQYLTPDKASIQSIGITPDIKLIPMSINKDRVDILESETFGEKDLEKHIKSTLVKAAKPLETLFYFEVKPDSDSEENESNSYTRNIDPQKDFALKFASLVLKQSQSQDRLQTIKAIKPLINKTQEEEKQKLTQALQKIGIDWSLNPIARGRPQASVTLDIESSQGQVLKAGEEVKLKLTVKNIGNAPFHRLIAHTKSERFLLKNREFIFGKIIPGASRSYSVPIKIPASALRREDKVLFSFKEGNQMVPEDFQSILVTQAAPRPSFSYNFELLENGSHGSRGDGDGKLEPGEKIVLKLKLSNVGHGTSQETIVNLKNLAGHYVFLSKGREKLLELTPGASKEARLSFLIDPKFKDEELKLELSVQDNESQEILSKKFQFPIGKNIPLARFSSETSPQLNFDKSPFPTQTNRGKITLTGKLLDRSGLKDLVIFVGDQKAYLKTFTSKATQDPVEESEFSAPLPLKKDENNLITILARDLGDLITRESFYIRRP